MAKQKRNRGRQAPPMKQVSPAKPTPTAPIQISAPDPISIPESAPVKSEPITIEDVRNSLTQAEFDAKKDALLEQLISDIEVLNTERDQARNEMEAANIQSDEIRSALAEIQGRLDAARSEYTKVQEELRQAQNDLEAAKNDVQKARDETQNTLASVEKKAQDIRDAAEKDRIATLAKASEEARSAWKVEADKLAKQYKDFAQETSLLEDSKRKLLRKEQDLKDEQEAISELKASLEKKKARYDSANPERIAALDLELSDNKALYNVLLEKHRELSEKHQKLQALMDTIKAEVEDPANGRYIATMNEIVDSLREYRKKYEDLMAVYTHYPDTSAIEALEKKVQQTDEIERKYETMLQERDRYRAEATAARNAMRELEVVRQEVEATSALNEHLLHELESHKTALESRTGDTCPSLTKVDVETETDDFINDISARTRLGVPGITLRSLVDHVRNFAGSRTKNECLYYTSDDIRAFLSGMAVSRLIILQGMSGTGKSSLPRIFSQAISGFNKLIPVESSWRDRNELLGYYNDFNRKFNAKSFTIELYRSSKKRCQEIPTFIVLDEMNLARIEYYFSDFLAILQEPNHDKWLIELVSSDMRTLPMELPESVKQKMQNEAPKVYEIWESIEKSRQGDVKSETSDDDKELLTAYLAKLGQLTGAKDLIDGRKIRVSDNIWFVGTANRDESTFEISDKVYDRAQVVSLNKKGVYEGKYKPTKANFISVTDLIKLFSEAKENKSTNKDVIERLDKLDAVLMKAFDLSFGNRIVTQSIDFVSVFVAAGGTVEHALDCQVSSKIIRKIITSDDEEALLELLDVVADYPETTRLLNKRLKELK